MTIGNEKDLAPGAENTGQDPSPVCEYYAVVYSPKRQRKRFPENCVQVMESESAVRAAARPTEKLYAARVIGPSRSSEGLMLYYLVSWLD